jgi:hypothetical protein
MLKAGEKASDQFARAWSCARDSLLNAWSMSCGPMALLVNYRMELKQRAHSPQISEWMQGNPRIILYNATSSRLYGQRSKRQRDAEATAKTTPNERMFREREPATHLSRDDDEHAKHPASRIESRMGFYNTVFFKVTRRIRGVSGIHALETNQAGSGASALRSLLWASSDNPPSCLQGGLSTAQTATSCRRWNPIDVCQRQRQRYNDLLASRSAQDNRALRGQSATKHASEERLMSHFARPAILSSSHITPNERHAGAGRAKGGRRRSSMSNRRIENAG